MKQWAVKLTLDYGLADRAHKGNQTLVNGKEVLSYPPSPRPLPESRRGWKALKEKLLLVAFGNLGQCLPFSQPWGWPAQGAARAAGSREGGLCRKDGEERLPPSAALPCELHRAQVPSGDTSPPHCCLPSHHCHAGLVFLLENVFCYDKLWGKVKLLTPRWGFRLAESARLVCPTSAINAWCPKGEAVWGSRALTVQRVLGLSIQCRRGTPAFCVLLISIPRALYQELL